MVQSYSPGGANVHPVYRKSNWLPWQRPFEPRNRLCLHRIAWHRKPTPRIKHRVASYTTKVIAHKANYSKLRLQIGCHGNISQRSWVPIKHMIPWAHSSPQPKRHLDRFSRFRTGDRRMSLYLQWDVLSPSKLPLPMGDLDPHLMHGSLGSPESSTQTASWSVQPFLQGSLVWQTDR